MPQGSHPASSTTPLKCCQGPRPSASQYSFAVALKKTCKLVFVSGWWQLRWSLAIITIYAVLCLLWIEFAQGTAPNIIAAAYNQQSLQVLNWIFQNHRSEPIDHYLDRWSMIASAVPIAMIMHLVIVLLIEHFDHKHRLLLHDAVRRSPSNAILITFSAAFLAVTVFSWAIYWAHGDYAGYLTEWMALLRGDDPWPLRGGDLWQNWYDGLPSYPFNSYGPLFNALAPLVWVNSYTNKLLFAFFYLAYVAWLVKDFGPRQGLVVFWWPWLGFWLLNPFPWVEVACFGYFDVLVGLACVAAVHNLVGKKEAVSGTYLGLGILLKYLPIVILPFLVFSQRRFHFRLLSSCVGVVIFGLLVSVLIWGTSTFLPLTFAARRPPYWSIYDVFASAHSPLRLFRDPPKLESLDWLEKPFLVIMGLGVFTWCVWRRTGPALSATLAVLVALLFYRMGFINYQLVLFMLISYWMVSEWRQVAKHSVLMALFGSYFGVLAILELAHWVDFPADSVRIGYIMFKFLSGCVLLIGLIQFSARQHHERPKD
jgi:Glycosyltransferase family 87